jgi:hypothetical protein
LNVSDDNEKEVDDDAKLNEIRQGAQELAKVAALADGSEAEARKRDILEKESLA